MNYKGLAIDTATEKGSISILHNADLLATLKLDKNVTHSSELLFRINQIIKKNALELADLDYVSFCRGPGSFTGIKIGAATALGLAKSIGCKCIGVTIFETLLGQIEKKRNSAVIFEGTKENLYLYKFNENGEQAYGTDEYIYTEIKTSEFDVNLLKDVSRVVISKELLTDKLYNLDSTKNRVKIIYASDNVSYLTGKLTFKLLSENYRGVLNKLPVYL